MAENNTDPGLVAEVADLRARLAEAEETLRAIRSGEADALVIAGSQGDEVHVLGGGDRIYRQFIETIREGTATVSAAGEIRSCSSSLAQTLRRPLDQLLGTAMRDHLSPDDHDIFASILAQACPESHHKKVRLKTSEGSLVPVYLSATRLHSDGAEPVCCLVFTDLREVVSAEQELRESEERYRALFDNSPDAVLLTIPDGRTLSANPAACRMFGRTAEELCALGRAGTVDTGDPRLEKLLEERARTGKVSGELTFLRGNGSSFQGEISSLIFHDSQGAVRASMIIRDVTGRQRAEEELRSSRLLYQQTLSSLNEAVLVVDVKTRSVLDCNQTTESIFGYSREELIGRDTRLLHVNDETFAAFAAEMLAQIAKQGFAEFDFQMRRKNGDVFPTEHFLRPLQEDDGNRFSVVSVIRDISDRKRIAEEKARLEDQLRQSQKVEAIGRLAGGVAHDFNNLTAIVLGYGEMLLGRLGPEDPTRKWVEQIIAAGNRSAALTRQLLAFSRRQVLLPVVLDLNELLLNLEKMLGRIIGEDIALSFELAGDLGRITADPGQLEQVVTNLVINARDAMPRGGRITVQTANAELDEAFVRDHASVIPGEYVRLALTDTGCGMDQATLARMFEPFFTTKGAGKGTGLGLATSFGIVKQSGGYMYVASEPGQGTTFTIYLPRTRAEAKVTATEADGKLPRGEDERILLVEDEAALRELCATVLSGLGYRVTTAGSGPEALLLAGEQGFEPDLVLTDVIMPGMSGAELAQQLRRDRPGLKVLYMSGYPDDAIAPHGILRPGISFLHKPFSDRFLAVKVREVLGVKAAAAPPGRRVLMIDDDGQYRELIRHFCTKQGQVFVGVESAGAALTALAAQPFDVLLVDLNIPGTSGERVLREMRAAGNKAPAIVLTGDVASADMDALRLLGVVQAVEKSGAAGPLLRAIEEAALREAPRAGIHGNE